MPIPKNLLPHGMKDHETYVNKDNMFVPGGLYGSGRQHPVGEKIDSSKVYSLEALAVKGDAAFKEVGGPVHLLNPGDTLQLKLPEGQYSVSTVNGDKWNITCKRFEGSAPLKVFIPKLKGSQPIQGELQMQPTEHMGMTQLIIKPAAPGAELKDTYYLSIYTGAEGEKPGVYRANPS